MTCSEGKREPLQWQFPLLEQLLPLARQVLPRSLLALLVPLAQPQARVQQVLLRSLLARVLLVPLQAQPQARVLSLLPQVLLQVPLLAQLLLQGLLLRPLLHLEPTLPRWKSRWK